MLESIIEFIKDMLIYIIIIAAIVLIRVYVISTVEVVGDSMEPNLDEGNIMLMDTAGHKYINFLDLKRFDVIVFSYSNPNYLIKRIIGMPGETVSYVDNKLYINEVLIVENFTINGTTDDYSTDAIPNNGYFVLGDNRNNSLDSRTIGFIPKEDILGKPFLRIWPLKQFNFVK